MEHKNYSTRTLSELFDEIFGEDVIIDVEADLGIGDIELEIKSEALGQGCRLEIEDVLVRVSLVVNVVLLVAVVWALVKIFW